METYQKRVIEEKEALNDKLEKLNHFLDKETYLTSKTQRQLHQQRLVMKLYSSILKERIEDFEQHG